MIPDEEVADDHVYGQSEAMCDVIDHGWICTRVDGHAGRHEAGTSSGTICAIWPGDDDEAF